MTYSTQASLSRRSTRGTIRAARRVLILAGAVCCILFGPRSDVAPKAFFSKCPTSAHRLEARDPEAFLRAHEEPALIRGRVPLTREEAVAQELVSHALSLTAEQGRVTAYVLCEEAAAVGYDPLFILALIRVESVYNHLAVSHVGAEGLMQLMPTTAEYLATRGHVPRVAGRAFDPETNVRLGVRYLAALDRSFSHRMDVALTAYNRGPAATRHLLRGHARLTAGVRASYANKVMMQYKFLRSRYGTLPFGGADDAAV